MHIAIFRLQLFKPSEPFIAGQACAMPTVHPILMGRKLFGHPPSGVKYFVPANGGGWSFHVSGHLPQVEQAMSEQNVQLIHAHFAIDALHAATPAKNLDLPLVTTLHGFDVTTRRTSFAMSGRPSLVRYALLQKRLKSQGALFICVSDFIRQNALERGFPENRLVTHYIGVDVDSFVQSEYSGPPHVLHVARLVEKKGTRYLLDAVAKLKKKNKLIKLDIVGDGVLRTILKKQIYDLELQDQVRLLGALPHAQVRALLQQTTALVLPSVTATNGDAEGLGLVLLEAAASGVPVIGTHHGGIPEAVVDGQTGILVDERNSDQIADAIMAIANNSALRAQMSLSARVHAKANFDISTQSAKLEHLYMASL